VDKDLFPLVKTIMRREKIFMGHVKIFLRAMLISNSEIKL